jgi:hypothetical protein
MGDIPVFGNKEIIQACNWLGFEIQTNRGKGGHMLAFHPVRKPLDNRKYPHITIITAKEICTIQFRMAIIKNFENFGFSRKLIVLALKGNKKEFRKIYEQEDKKYKEQQRNK